MALLKIHAYYEIEGPSAADRGEACMLWIKRQRVDGIKEAGVIEVDKFVISPWW